MDKKSNKRDIVKNLMYIRLVVYVIFATVLLIIPLEITESGSICLIYRLTGFKCITCGMTRAFANALRFDFVRAISYNKLILLFYPTYIVLFVNDLYVFIKRLFGFRCKSITEWMLHKIFYIEV